MKKQLIAYSILGILIFITVFLYICGMTDYILYICRYLPYPNILYVAVMITGLFSCIFILHQNKETVGGYIFLILFCLIVCVLMSLTGSYGSDPKITCLESPDQKHELVFIENYRMFYWDGDVYEKTNNVFMKRIYSYSSEQRPAIYNGDYILNWNEEDLILYPKPGVKNTVETIRYTPPS